MTLARALVAVCFSVTSATLWVACSNSSRLQSPAAGWDGGRDDAGVNATCGVSNQCPRHNDICVRDPGANEGACLPPTRGGLCAPTGDATSPEVPGCYPGARCQPVPQTQSELGGMCSFTGTPGAIFQLPDGPKIALQEPSPFNTYGERQAISFRWTPPPGQTADTTAVAVLMRRVPQRDANYNRLRNPQDIVWIWSSTEPGGAAPGSVSLRAGRQGVRADGTLGDPYTSDSLAPGRYWWMTYTLRDGGVRATSEVFSFRVGDDIAEQPCTSVAQCIALIPGESSDLVACVYGLCRRRCASDMDCPGAGRGCNVATTLDPPDGGMVDNDIPRGGFCGPR